MVTSVLPLSSLHRITNFFTNHTVILACTNLSDLGEILFIKFVDILSSLAFFALSVPSYVESFEA